MKVLIAGCGYVGTALGQEMSEDGAEVWGLRRDWSKVDPAPGFHALQADLLEPRALKDLPAVDYVLLCQSPSRESDTYESTYFRATKNLLDAVWGERLKKIVLVSTTGVYAVTDGSWVDEIKGALDESSVILKTERMALKESRHAVVLRLGGIYGPGRNRIAAIKSGAFKPALSDDCTNRIYVDDVVSCIRLLFKKGKPGEMYLGVDDAPCTQREFYSWLYDKLSLPKPLSGTDRMRPHGSNKRCSNKKIRNLGMKFKYPSYREGYETLLRTSS